MMEITADSQYLKAAAFAIGYSLSVIVLCSKKGFIAAILKGNSLLSLGLRYFNSGRSAKLFFIEACKEYYPGEGLEARESQGQRGFYNAH